MVRAIQALAACISLAEAAVQVRKTNQGPTGYEVTITYQNTSVSDVKIGSLQHLTDQVQDIEEVLIWIRS